MAELTPQTVDRDGLAPTLTSASAGGDKWTNTGKEFLYVDNADASSHTVTLDIIKQVDGQDAADRTVDVGAGAFKLIGPFPKGIYNDTDDFCNVSYDAVTSVTVGVLKLTTDAALL